MLASGAQALGAAESAVTDQHVTLELIESKRQQSKALAPEIYGLYGQSPYFLMTLLSSNKINDFFNSHNGNNPREVLMALYAQFDHVYQSAMELKVLSLSTSGRFERRFGGRSRMILSWLNSLKGRIYQRFLMVNLHS